MLYDDFQLQSHTPDIVNQAATQNDQQHSEKSFHSTFLPKVNARTTNKSIPTAR